MKPFPQVLLIYFLFLNISSAFYIIKTADFSKSKGWQFDSSFHSFKWFQKPQQLLHPISAHYQTKPLFHSVITATIDVISPENVDPSLQIIDLFRFPTVEYPQSRIIEFIQHWGSKMMEMGEAVLINNIENGIKMDFPIDSSIQVNLTVSQDSANTVIQSSLLNSVTEVNEEDSSLQSLIHIVINSLLESFVTEVNTKLAEQLKSHSMSRSSSPNSHAVNIPPIDADCPPEHEKGKEEGGDKEETEAEEEEIFNRIDIKELDKHAIPIDQMLSPEELQSLLWEDIPEEGNGTSEALLNDSVASQGSSILEKASEGASSEQSRTDTSSAPETIPQRKYSTSKESSSNSVQPDAIDKSESLLCNIEKAEKSDYFKVEKLLLHWLNDYERKHLPDKLQIAIIEDNQLPELRKTNQQASKQSPYSTSQMERAVALTFVYKHDNFPENSAVPSRAGMNGEGNEENYQFFFFYYYFPEIKQIQFFFRRDNELITQRISKPMEIIMNQFQQKFVEEIKNIKYFIEFQSYSSPTAEEEEERKQKREKPYSEEEFQALLEKDGKIENMQSMEKVIEEMNRKLLLNPVVATPASSPEIDKAKVEEKEVSSWNFKEEELRPIVLMNEELEKAKEVKQNAKRKVGASPVSAEQRVNNPPEVTYSEDPMIPQKQWKEPSPFKQRLIRLGMEAEKYKSPDLQDEAVKEVNKILTASRKKGFFQTIKQYEEAIQSEKNQEDNSSKLQKELEELFQQGKKLSELNLQRLIERNAGEPSSRYEGYYDLSEPLQEKIALFHKIMTNQQVKYDTPASSQLDQDTFEKQSERQRRSVDVTIPQILDNDELVTPTDTTKTINSRKTNKVESSAKIKKPAEEENASTPLEKERIIQLKQWTRDKLSMLVTELETNSIDIHPLILDGFRDVLLSDYLPSILEELTQTETNPHRRTTLFPKIIDKTVSLYQELVSLIKTESTKHLQTIQEICDIAQKYQKENDLLFLNALDGIKHKFDVPLLQYLSYLIQQYEQYFQQQDVKLIKDPKLIELLQEQQQQKQQQQQSSDNESAGGKAMLGDKYMKARELFTDSRSNRRRGSNEQQLLNENDDEATIQLKENYKWYHILQILYNGVAYEFQHRYEILLDFIFILLRFDNHEEIHKLLFQNIMDTIPVVDLKYFQLLARNIIQTILYNPNPSKEIQFFIQQNPQIIRQVLILEQDLFCYCNDAIIEEKLQSFQDQLAERGERMIITHRNPERQQEMDILEEMRKRNLQTSFGYLKNEEERFGEKKVIEKKKNKRVISSSKGLAKATIQSTEQDDPSKQIDFKDFHLSETEEENEKTKPTTAFDNKQKFQPVYDRSQEKYSLSPKKQTIQPSIPEDNNESSEEDGEDDIIGDLRKKTGDKLSDEKKLKKRNLTSRGYTKKLLNEEEEENPKRVAYYKEIERKAIEEITNAINLNLESNNIQRE